MTSNEANEYSEIFDIIQKRREAVPARKAPVVDSKEELSLAGKLKIYDYHEQIMEGARKDLEVAEAVHKQRVIGYLKEWENSLEPRWRNADIREEDFSPEAKVAIENALNEYKESLTVPGPHQTSLMFVGRLGRGKTWSAYAYLKELIRHGYVAPSQIWHTTESKLGAITYSGYDKNKLQSELLDDKYKAYFIDDVGRGSFREIGQKGEIWFEIVNKAYARNIPLIITSNLPVTNPDDPGKDLVGYLGHGPIDRIKSMVADEGYVIFAQGENKRQTLADNKRSEKAKTPLSKMATGEDTSNFHSRKPASKKKGPLF